MSKIKILAKSNLKPYFTREYVSRDKTQAQIYHYVTWWLIDSDHRRKTKDLFACQPKKRASTALRWSKMTKINIIELWPARLPYSTVALITVFLLLYNEYSRPHFREFAINCRKFWKISFSHLFSQLYRARGSSFLTDKICTLDGWRRNRVNLLKIICSWNSSSNSIFKTVTVCIFPFSLSPLSAHW